MNSTAAALVVLSILAIIFISIQKRFKAKLKIEDILKKYNDKDYITVKEMLEEFLISDPANSFAAWLMYHSNLALKEYEMALAAIRKVISINHYKHEIDNPELTKEFNELGAHKALRDLYKTKRDSEKIFAENQILMQIDPGNPEYPLECGLELLKNREYSERTQSFFSQALELGPNLVETLCWQAFTHLKKENFNKAKNYAQKSLGINPGYLDAKYIMGEVALKAGKFEMAKQMLEPAAASINFQKSASLGLAKAAYQEGNFDTAETWADRAVSAPLSNYELPELEWESKYFMGLVFETLSKNKSALKMFENIHKFNPEYKDVAQKIQSIDASKEGQEFIKDYMTVKADLFSTISEEIISKLGYNIQKVEVSNDGNLSMVVKNQDISPKVFCVFVRRNYYLINEDQIKNLKRFMHSVGAHGGIFINTGEFSITAKNLAAQSKIELYHGAKIESILAKIMKAGK